MRSQTFFALAPTLWNQLPVELHLAPSLVMLRRQLKMLLFKRAVHTDPYTSGPTVTYALGATCFYYARCFYSPLIYPYFIVTFYLLYCKLPRILHLSKIYMELLYKTTQ